MTYILSEKEYDALLIAGFTSVEELLKRYFELQKEVNIAKAQPYQTLNVVGSAVCTCNGGEHY